jgi:hypothetical protein
MSHSKTVQKNPSRWCLERSLAKIEEEEVFMPQKDIWEFVKAVPVISETKTDEKGCHLHLRLLSYVILDFCYIAFAFSLLISNAKNTKNALRSAVYGYNFNLFRDLSH